MALFERKLYHLETGRGRSYLFKERVGCLRRVATVEGCFSLSVTLGTDVVESDTLGADGGEGILGGDKEGNGCVRLRRVASSNRALRTGSPAVRLGVVDKGGDVSMEIISVAACFK